MEKIKAAKRKGNWRERKVTLRAQLAQLQLEADDSDIYEDIPEVIPKEPVAGDGAQQTYQHEADHQEAAGKCMTTGTCVNSDSGKGSGKGQWTEDSEQNQVGGNTTLLPLHLTLTTLHSVHCCLLPLPHLLSRQVPTCLTNTYFFHINIFFGLVPNYWYNMHRF